MNFKKTIDSLIGRTSSSNVSVIEKTHFNGALFRKVIDIEEDVNVKNQNAKRMDNSYPNSAPHKPYGNDYRFYFRLDLAKRPNTTKLYQLIDYANRRENYKIHTELVLSNTPARFGANDDGYRTNYLGYQFCDWLEIEPDLILEGETTCLWKWMAHVFPGNWTDISEVVKDGQNILLREENVLREEHVNVFVQKVLMNEVEIFLKEVLKIISPN